MKRKVSIGAICLTFVICVSLLLSACTDKSKETNSNETSPEGSESIESTLSRENTSSQENVSSIKSADTSSTPFEPNGNEESVASVPICERSESILYQPHSSLPAYTVTVIYKDADKQNAEQLVVTGQKTEKELQSIAVDLDTERFTDEPAYVIDLNFDGYADLMIPHQRTGDNKQFHAFIWDTETKQLVFATGFSELSYIRLDADRKQILHCRYYADCIRSYGISVYDPEQKNFVLTHFLYWDSVENNMTYFKELNAKGESINAFTFSGTELDLNDPHVKPYIEKGSVWDLKSYKWGFFELLDFHDNDNEPDMIFADYGDESELNDRSLFYHDFNSTLVKISVTKKVKNFKFITVSEDLYAEEVLFELASLTPDTPFYANTIVGEGFSSRGIAFENENGETECYQINFDGRGEGPHGFGLRRILPNPTW